jgi:hypothetical protein
MLTAHSMVNPLEQQPRVDAVAPWRELAAHVLAFVPARGPASLSASAYTTFVRARFHPDAWRLLDDAAPTLAALHDQAGLAAAGVELLPWCFRDATRLTAALRAEPTAWTLADVDHPAALALAVSPSAALSSLTALAATEMALASRSFLAGYAQHLGPAMEVAVEAVGPWMARAGALAPGGGAEAGCALSAVLGPRGRAWAGIGGDAPAVLVGAPLPWTGLPPSHAALQWLHERAVLAAQAVSPRRQYLDVEAVAWRALTALVQDSALAAEHVAWQGRFDSRAVADRAARVAEDAVEAVVTRLRG